MNINLNVDSLEQFMHETIDIFEKYPLMEIIALTVLNNKRNKKDCITDYFNTQSSLTPQTKEYNYIYNYFNLYYNDYGDNKIILLNDLNEDIKKYILSIMKDINIFQNINNINMNDQWQKTKNNLISSELSEELFISNTSYTDKLKLQIDNMTNYKNNLIGGYNALEALGINEIYIHKSTRKSSKYLSTSLFDRGSASVNKNINHYSLCLYLSLKLYEKYLPEFNIALYIDESITTSDNNNVKTLLEYLKNQKTVDIILINQTLNDISLIDKTGKNTIGLYGAFYRFFIYLRADVEIIVMIDADNFPTERFCDYVKDFVLKSKSKTIKQK